MKLFNGKLRYLIVFIPFIFICLFALAYQNLKVEIEASLLREKFLEKQQSVDLLAGQIDAYIETPAFQSGYGRFELILSAGMAHVDAQPFTFAALYDEQLENVSARHPSYTSAFEPLNDSMFKDAVMSNEHGTYVMPFTPAGEETRDMHIYYRWIPSDVEMQGRYLAVIAVSRYSIESTMPDGVWYLPIAMCAVTTIFITAAVWLLCYLGEIYKSRSGNKHRGASDEDGKPV